MRPASSQPIHDTTTPLTAPSPECLPLAADRAELGTFASRLGKRLKRNATWMKKFLHGFR